MFYFGTASWGWGSWARRPHVPDGATAFGVVRSPTLIIMLGAVVALETAGLHLLIARWSIGAAWVLTALNAYTVLWVVADYRALALRPIVLSGDELLVRVGLRFSASVPRALIERVERSTWRDASTLQAVNLAAPDDPNVLITFREPVRARRLFGIETFVRGIGLRLENPDGFLAQACPGSCVLRA